jgi:hypothetical protein
MMLSRPFKECSVRLSPAKLLEKTISQLYIKRFFPFKIKNLLKGVAEAHKHCTIKMIYLTCTLPNHRVGTIKSLR